MSFHNLSVNVQSGDSIINQNNDENTTEYNNNHSFSTATYCFNDHNASQQINSEAYSQEIEEDMNNDSQYEEEFEFYDEDEGEEEGKENDNNFNQQQSQLPASHASLNGYNSNGHTNNNNDTMNSQHQSNDEKAAAGTDGDNDINQNNNNNGRGDVLQVKNNQILKPHQFRFGSFCIEINSIAALFEFLDELKDNKQVLVLFYNIKKKVCHHLRGTMDIVMMNHPEIDMLCIEMGAAGFLGEAFNIFMAPTVFMMDNKQNITNRHNGLQWVIPFGDYWEYQADYLEYRMVYNCLLSSTNINNGMINKFYPQQNTSNTQVLQDENNQNHQNADADDNDDDDEDMIDID